MLMIIEGGLVVAYLTAALVRGGERMADRAVDKLLVRLTDLVVDRMGSRLIDRLTNDPRDEVVQREVALIIDGATSVDANFARDIGEVVAELDRQGGRQILNEVYAQSNVQAFDRSMAIGRDFNYFNASDQTGKSEEAVQFEWSELPGWVRFCMGLGLVLFFGSFLADVMVDSEFPSKVAAVGFVVLVAALFYAGYLGQSSRKGR